MLPTAIIMTRFFALIHFSYIVSASINIIDITMLHQYNLTLSRATRRKFKQTPRTIWYPPIHGFTNNFCDK